MDTLKIDRSFIQKLSLSREDGAIVRAGVMMARTMNLQVTSEGVETQEQFAQLYALGCDQAPRYLFGRPLTAQALAAYLAARTGFGGGNGAPAPLGRLSIFGERFWLGTDAEQRAFMSTGAIPPQRRRLQKRVRGFFGWYTNFAEVYMGSAHETEKIGFFRTFGESAWFGRF